MLTASFVNPAAPDLAAQVGGLPASLRHSDGLPLGDCQKVKSGPGGSLPRLLTLDLLREVPQCPCLPSYVSSACSQGFSLSHW